MKSAHSFHIIAKPIGPVCNIRCEYCFYLEKEKLFGHGKKSDYVMSDEVLEAFIKQYIAAQPEGTPEINFAWQGGEPMLLPQSFFEKALKFQQKHKLGSMQITNAIQTNGMLITPERAKWFKENDFLIGISVDGDEPLHNKYRKTRDGEGTFVKVIRGIENLKSVGAQFNILTVVQNDNSNHPKRVYDFFTKELGAEFLQFIPIVEPLGNGGVSHRSVTPKQWGRFMSAIF